MITFMEELEQSNEKIEEIKIELFRIRLGSELFDESDMEVKKMVTSHIIKRVNVFRDY